MRYQHRKGGFYTEIGEGKVQTDTPLVDYDEVTVYRSEADGSVWVRPTKEFNDGRFIGIGNEPPPATILCDATPVAYIEVGTKRVALYAPVGWRVTDIDILELRKGRKP